MEKRSASSAGTAKRVRLNREPRAHRWDDVGERCLDCGDKDWMGGPCSGPHHPSPGSKGGAWAIKLARESALGHCNDHAYLPQTREETNSWQPHDWVVAAIQTALLSAQPSPSGQDVLDCIGRIEEAIEFRVPHDIYAAVHGELAELKAALAARQPVKQPVIWVSPGQLAAHKDRVPGDGGAYLPARFTRDGQFTKPLYATPTAQAVDLAPASIPDTPEVRDILGRPNFWCSPWANVLRRRGDVIPCKAEEEQAAVIRFMLNYYLAHGAGWAEAAEAEIQAIRYQVLRND